MSKLGMIALIALTASWTGVAANAVLREDARPISSPGTMTDFRVTPFEFNGDVRSLPGPAPEAPRRLWRSSPHASRRR